MIWSFGMISFNQGARIVATIGSTNSPYRCWLKNLSYSTSNPLPCSWPGKSGGWWCKALAPATHMGRQKGDLAHPGPFWQFWESSTSSWEFSLLSSPSLCERENNNKIQTNKQTKALCREILLVLTLTEHAFSVTFSLYYSLCKLLVNKQNMLHALERHWTKSSTKHMDVQ